VAVAGCGVAEGVADAVGVDEEVGCGVAEGIGDALGVSAEDVCGVVEDTGGAAGVGVTVGRLCAQLVHKSASKRHRFVRSLR